MVYYIYIYNLNRLIIIQNKAIRAIFNISNRCNTDKYYKILNILKFTDIVKLNTLKFMFRIFNNLHQSLSKICSLLINVYIVREKFLNLLFLLSVLI